VLELAQTTKVLCGPARQVRGGPAPGGVGGVVDPPVEVHSPEDFISVKIQPSSSFGLICSFCGSFSCIQLRCCEGDGDPEEQEEGESFEGSHGACGEGVGVVMVMKEM